MSEFNELIKSFSKSRDYVRDFFVYGFKTRDDFTGWSSRTYDTERRRLESWLPEYVNQDYTEKGKNIYLSIDSNLLSTNPLYRVLKKYYLFLLYQFCLHKSSNKGLAGKIFNDTIVVGIEMDSMNAVRTGERDIL